MENNKENSYDINTKILKIIFILLIFSNLLLIYIYINNKTDMNPFKEKMLNDLSHFELTYQREDVNTMEKKIYEKFMGDNVNEKNIENKLNSLNQYIYSSNHEQQLSIEDSVYVYDYVNKKPYKYTLVSSKGYLFNTELEEQYPYTIRSIVPIREFSMKDSVYIIQQTFEDKKLLDLNRRILKLNSNRQLFYNQGYFIRYDNESVFKTKIKYSPFYNLNEFPEFLKLGEGRK